MHSTRSDRDSLPTIAAPATVLLKARTIPKAEVL